MADFCLDDLIDETVRDLEDVPCSSRCLLKEGQLQDSTRAEESTSTDAVENQESPLRVPVDKFLRSDLSPTGETKDLLAVEGPQEALCGPLRRKNEPIGHGRASVFTSETAASVDALAAEHWLGEETGASSLRSSSWSSSAVSSTSAPSSPGSSGNPVIKTERVISAVDDPGVRAPEGSDHYAESSRTGVASQKTSEQPAQVGADARVDENSSSEVGRERSLANSELQTKSPSSSVPPHHPQVSSSRGCVSSPQNPGRRADPISVCLRELEFNIRDSPENPTLGHHSESPLCGHPRGELQGDGRSRDSAPEVEGDTADNEEAGLSKLLQSALGLLSGDDLTDEKRDRGEKAKERENGVASWLPSFFRGGGTKKAETEREEKSVEDDVDFFQLLKEMSEEVEGEDLLFLAVGEPLKHLLSEYEPWLEKEKEKLPQKDRHRYEQQIHLYRRIVSLCEKDEVRTAINAQKDLAEEKSRDNCRESGDGDARKNKVTDNVLSREADKLDREGSSETPGVESVKPSSSLSSSTASSTSSSSRSPSAAVFPPPPASSSCQEPCPPSSLPSSGPPSSPDHTQGLPPPTSESKPSSPLAIVEKLSRLQEFLDELNSLGEPPEEVMEKLFPEERESSPVTTGVHPQISRSPTLSCEKHDGSTKSLPSKLRGSRPEETSSLSQAFSSQKTEHSKRAASNDSSSRSTLPADNVTATASLSRVKATTSAKVCYGPERPPTKSQSREQKEEERVIEDFLSFVEALEKVEKEGGKELESLLTDPEAVEKMVRGDTTETPDALLRLLDELQFDPFQGSGMTIRSKKEVSNHTRRDNKVQKESKAVSMGKTLENEDDHGDSCRQQ